MQDDPAQPRAADVPPEYWLAVCRGAEAAQAFVASDAVGHVLAQYPILLLPEFPAALEALARTQTNHLAADLYRHNAEALGDVQAEIRRSYPHEYAMLLGQCGTDLNEETRGDRRINLARAVECFQIAGELFAAGPESAGTLMNEGIARQSLAELGEDARLNLVEAVRLFQRAAAAFGPGDDAARCLLYEATSRETLAELGVDARANLDKAIHLARQASVMFAPGPDAARCLVTEANARQRLADLGIDTRANVLDAVRLYRHARQSLGAGRDFAGTLVNEGNARLRLATLGMDQRGNLEEAVTLFRQARQLFGPGPDYATSLMNEATGHRQLAELGVDAHAHLEEAVQLYAEARAIFGAGPDAASCLLNEGNVRQMLAELGGDRSATLTEAADLYRRAGEMFLALGFSSHAVTAFGNGGRLLRREQRWEEARAAFERAISALETIRADIVFLRDRRALMEWNIRLFKDMVDTCLHLERFAEALEYVERGRGRALVDLLFLQEVTPKTISPQQAATYGRLRRRAEELEALSAEPGALRAALEPDAGAQQSVRVDERVRIAEQLQALEEEIRRVDPDFFALAESLRLDGMRDLARSLQRTLVILWVGPTQSALFFVPPSGALDHLVLSAVNDDTLQEWMRGPATAAMPTGWMGTYLRYRSDELDRGTWLTQIEETLFLLYDHIMGPACSWLTAHGARRIALITAGTLGLFPLHAAAWREGGTIHHLIEELDIVSAPSAWVLDRCRRRALTRWTPLLAVGNPDGSLPFSAWETEEIERLVEQTGAPHAVDRLAGSAASQERVEKLLPSHPVAHFSCHASWDFQDPLQSGVVLAGEERLPLARLLGQVDLDQARLVVLSACDSGTGYDPRSRGEEYLGLPAGFIIAGAPAVVGSLWSVLDPPTALLMRRMYQHLFTGMGVAEALRQAQLWLRDLPRGEAMMQVEESDGTAADLAESYRQWVAHLDERPFAHPYYWAAFTVLGSPAPLIS